MSHVHTSGATSATLSLNELIQSAEMLQLSGKYQEAIDLYRQWLTHGRDEKKHLAWFNYGWLLQKQNKVHEASTAYEKLADDYAHYLSNQALSA